METRLNGFKSGQLNKTASVSDHHVDIKTLGPMVFAL